MIEYKVPQETINKSTKLTLIIFLCIGIFFLCLLALSADDLENINFLEISIIGGSILLILCLSVYVGIKLAHKKLLKTSLILEDTYFILKKIKNRNVIGMDEFKMNYLDIKSIKKTSSGIVVKGNKLFNKIIIPNVFDNSDEILSKIEENIIINKMNSEYTNF